MYRFRTWISVMSSLLVLTACQPEPVAIYDVPASIQPYVDAFKHEASLRGVELEIDALLVEFQNDLEDSQGNDAAGLCYASHAADPTPRIQLDTTSFNWRANEYTREILVFHELGHCILNRLVHRDDNLPNGNHASMMRSTGAQVYGGVLNSFKRSYYLDELFDETTESPEWALNKPDLSALQASPTLIENFDDNQNGWNIGNSQNSSTSIQDGRLTFTSKSSTNAFYSPNSFDVPTQGNFELETQMKITDGSGLALFEWGGSSANDFFFAGFNNEKVLVIGNWLYGFSLVRTFEAIKPNDFNTLTIRRIGTFYHLYLNGEYVDVLSYESFYGDQIAYYIGPASTVEVESMRISSLP
ncbi:MAG: hypothetical protein AAFR61_18305 [Bacteroidota bacterium]